MIARIVLVIVLLYGGYNLFFAWTKAEQSAPQVLKQVAEKVMQQQLCKTPLYWRIGQLDPAFSLTFDQAIQAATYAADQWNEAMGFELFRYDAQDGFAINFHYDERQQSVLQQAMLQRNIQRYDDNIAQRTETLAEQSELLRQRQRDFAIDNEQFAADAAEFQHRAAKVTQANQQRLQQEQQQLIYRQQVLQQRAEQLNAEQARLQRQHTDLNNTVNDRNAMLTAQQPLAIAEVGLMEMAQGERRMTIFAYSNEQALQLTIAHEFGHALGLGHTTNPAALMHYSLNPAQTGPTAEDIAMLKQQCSF